MPRQLVVHITCGICHQPIPEDDEAFDRPLRFAWEGRGWEVDVCAEHLAAITEVVGPYVAAAVPAGQLGSTPAKRKSPPQPGPKVSGGPGRPAGRLVPVAGWLCPECGNLTRGGSNLTRRHLQSVHKLSAAETVRRLPMGTPGRRYEVEYPELAHLAIRKGDPRLEL